MSASTFYGRAAILSSQGTTANYYKLGSTASGAARHQKFDAIEVYVNSTASTGWVRFDGSAAVAGAAKENVIVPKGRNSIVIPYTSKISVVCSSKVVVNVRGISRGMLG